MSDHITLDLTVGTRVYACGYCAERQGTILEFAGNPVCALVIFDGYGPDNASWRRLDKLRRAF